MKAVNLLPHEESAGRGFGRFDPLVVGGAVLTFVVVAGTAGGFLLEHSRAGSERQQLSAAQAQLAAAQARIQHEQQLHPKKTILPTPSVTSQEQPWRDAVASAMSTRIAFDRTLQEFELVIPSDITLTSLQMGAPVPGAAPTTPTPGSTSGGGQFSLAGTAFSEDAVARLLSRLMLVPDLSGVSLQSSTADPQTGVVTFSIQAQVKGAPAPPPAPSTDGTSTDTTTTTGAAA